MKEQARGTSAASMEEFIRRVIKQLGTRLDRLLSRPADQLKLEDLLEGFYDALDSNLDPEASGTDQAPPLQWNLRFSSERFPPACRKRLDRWRTEIAAAGDQYLVDHRRKVQGNIRIAQEEVAGLASIFEFVPVSRPTGMAMHRLFLAYVDEAKPPIRLSKLLSTQRVLLGRSTEADIVIDHPSVSRFHASLNRDREGHLHLSDCRSANGTFVNEQGVYDRRRIQPGDELRLGSIKLRLENEAGEEPADR